jgi:hypothetical protein
MLLLLLLLLKPPLLLLPLCISPGSNVLTPLLVLLLQLQTPLEQLLLPRPRLGQCRSINCNPQLQQHLSSTGLRR